MEEGERGGEERKIHVEGTCTCTHVDTCRRRKVG